MNAFINENERRPRAGWRLLIQLALMTAFTVMGVAGIGWLVPSSLVVVSTFAQAVGAVGSVWIAAHVLDKRPFWKYGLRIQRQWWNEFLIGIVIAALAVGAIFLVEYWAGWLKITGYGWNTPVKTSFGMGLASSFLAMLMVGFYEELFARGYQVLNLTEGLRYPQIGAGGAAAIAVLITSALFGFMHFFNPNASMLSTTNIILAGIVLAVPYILTGSLALSIGLHFSWNFSMGGIAGFPVSGLHFESSILQINQLGAELWTGGAFGPEAGIVGWMGMAIMLGLSCVYINGAGYDLRLAELFQEAYKPPMESDEQSL